MRKAPMSKQIANLIRTSGNATKIVEAIIEERSIEGVQAIKIGTDRYKPIGFRTKDNN